MSVKALSRQICRLSRDGSCCLLTSLNAVLFYVCFSVSHYRVLHFDGFNFLVDTACSKMPVDGLQTAAVVSARQGLLRLNILFTAWGVAISSTAVGSRGAKVPSTTWHHILRRFVPYSSTAVRVERSTRT